MTKHLKLKTELLVIYTIFIFIFITLILYIASNIFMNNFSHYIKEKHDKFASEIVKDVLYLYTEKGSPSYNDLYKIGMRALDEGMIFMFNDNVDNSLICISEEFPTHSDNMINSMANTMKSLYPHIQGKYQEDIFIVQDDNDIYGYVTLGYYGPMYYTEFDILFLQTVRKAIYTAGILFFSISSIIIYLLIDRITKPINLASKKAVEISCGDYNGEISDTSNIIEIKHLVSSINLLSKKLDEQQKVKKQLAQNYAHEIRTPLTCVLTTIEGMQDGIFEPSEERLQVLYNDISRIHSLINNVDKLVETSTNIITLNKSKVELTNIINSILQSYEDMFKNKNIKVTFDTNKKIELLADKEHIQSLFTNFISNAYKYTDENGEIYINIEEYKNDVHISIRDTGIGIEEDELQLIFEHLYRVEQSRVKIIDGFGIGLSLCKNIVKMHNGKIEVNSKIGEGSEFIITLPKI